MCVREGVYVREGGRGAYGKEGHFHFGTKKKWVGGRGRGRGRGTGVREEERGTYGKGQFGTKQ